MTPINDDDFKKVITSTDFQTEKAKINLKVDLLIKLNLAIIFLLIILIFT
jgi:hypothetical protein